MLFLDLPQGQMWLTDSSHIRFPCWMKIALLASPSASGLFNGAILQSDPMVSRRA